MLKILAISCMLVTLKCLSPKLKSPPNFRCMCITSPHPPWHPPFSIPAEAPFSADSPVSMGTLLLSLCSLTSCWRPGLRGGTQVCMKKSYWYSSDFTTSCVHLEPSPQRVSIEKTKGLLSLSWGLSKLGYPLWGRGHGQETSARWHPCPAQLLPRACARKVLGLCVKEK